MANISSLQAKVNDLKAKVTQNSITPTYLGSLLDDFIEVISPISSLSQITAELSRVRAQVSALTPVECVDEDDVARKAASGNYPANQLFFIPETD